jgi:nitroreductase
MEKDIFEMIKTRRSIRKYKKEVPDETLIRRCIEVHFPRIWSHHSGC